MIGEAWWRLLCLPFIVVVAFQFFCLVLVVLAVGYIDPKSSPRAELDRLNRLLDRLFPD